MVSTFYSFRIVNLTVDYARPSESSVSGSAELRINDDLVEINASYDWPGENSVPLELQFSISSPFKYEVVLLNWKTEDPLSAAEFSASIKGNAGGRYNLAPIKNYNAPFKIEKSVEEQDDAVEIAIIFESATRNIDFHSAFM